MITSPFSVILCILSTVVASPRWCNRPPLYAVTSWQPGYTATLIFAQNLWSLHFPFDQTIELSKANSIKVCYKHTRSVVACPYVCSFVSLMNGPARVTDINFSACTNLVFLVLTSKFLMHRVENGVPSVRVGIICLRSKFRVDRLIK